jgi:hypothetical protein
MDNAFDARQRDCPGSRGCGNWGSFMPYGWWHSVSLANRDTLAAGGAAFTSRGPRLVAGPLVRGAECMCCAPALAGDLALLLAIHRSEATSSALPLAFYRLRHIRFLLGHEASAPGLSGATKTAPHYDTPAKKTSSTARSFVSMTAPFPVNGHVSTNGAISRPACKNALYEPAVRNMPFPPAAPSIAPEESSQRRHYSEAQPFPHR